MTMSVDKFELLKEKYRKDWERLVSELGEEKALEVFLKYARAKERLLRAKERVQAITERERKREARALIILSKLLIREKPEVVKEVLQAFPSEFIQRERKQDIDYSGYIIQLLQKPHKPQEEAKEKAQEKEEVQEAQEVHSEGSEEVTSEEVERPVKENHSVTIQIKKLRH